MAISLSGLGSGFDWQSMVDQLRQVEQQQKVAPLSAQKSKQQSRLSAWQSMGSKLSTLKSSMDDLKDSSDFNVYKAKLASSSSTVTAESLLSATAGTSAGKGSYDITVNELAKGRRLESDGAAFSSLTTTGVATGQLTVNGQTTATLDGMNLTQVRDAINGLNSGTSATGVTASILQVTGGETPTYRLLLASDKTGVKDTVNNVMNGEVETSGSSLTFASKQTPLDASLTVNGTTVTRSTNSISDVIPGVTLALNKKDPATTVTVAVDKDTEAIEGKVKKFVDAYNDVMGFINQQSTYTEGTNTTGGPLFGDATMKGIKSKIQSAVLGARSPSDAPLSSAGITFASDNTLKLDSTKFQEAIKTNFDDTVSLFNTFGESLSTSLNSYTDSIDGTLTLQQKTIQSSMDNLDKRAASTQERIERTMTLLTNQFIKMDSAVGQMQSQSSYLSAQLGL